MTNIPSIIENHCLRLENEEIKKIEVRKIISISKSTLLKVSEQTLAGMSYNNCRKKLLNGKFSEINFIAKNIFVTKNIILYY